jgi:hypothetical protein
VNAAEFSEVTMRGKFPVFTLFLIISVCLLCSFNLSFAQKKTSEPLTIGIEGGKLLPVTFSHKTHTEKSKIDCAVCHHRDKNPKEPQSCFKCHPAKDSEDNTPPAKKAFHKMCIACHKESLAKDITAPTKCNECHRK